VQGGKVRVQAGLTSGALLTALREVSEPYKVLHFTSMIRGFKNFTDPGALIALPTATCCLRSACVLEPVARFACHG
jgi:hypothetical protein